MWDPVEDVRRAVINVAQRGDECAVNTFWQLTINSPTQRPRVDPMVRMHRFLWVCNCGAGSCASHPGLGSSKWHPDAVIALLDRAQWN